MAAYKKRETTNSFIRQLMSLPFLPLQHIRPAFEKLANRVSSAKLVSLVEYIRRQWIENGTFTRKSWCVYQRTTRTNNYVEGWHRRLNNRAGEQELSFYRLVPLLHAEARLIPIQMQMLKESKLRRYVRKTACDYCRCSLSRRRGNSRGRQRSLSQERRRERRTTNTANGKRIHVTRHEESDKPNSPNHEDGHNNTKLSV
ncbi:hypothetical protein ScPMuIL_003551 [Solemya velum]